MKRALIWLAFLGLGVALAFALGGCGSLEERPLKVGSEIRTITLTRSYQAQDECAAEIAVAPGWKVIACASFNTAQCTIKMLPDASDDTLGHETRHCFDGYWHR